MAILGIVALLAQGSAVAAEGVEALQFSEGFLIGGKAIDMQRYVAGNPIAPGVYPLDIVVNGAFQEKRDITFAATADGVDACLPVSLLRTLGLKPAYLAGLDDDAACVDLASRVEGASVELDSGNLQLLVSVPQAVQARSARGHVPLEQRDTGITAAFFDYTLNHTAARNQDSTYLGLTAGANLGAWRLRHRASYSHSTYATRHDVISSYAQRDLPRWSSQLLLGQGSTGGELFESVSFTGARVATDERMLPDSLRGFAPVVRGIAEGTAVVSIRQNGNVIHEVSVAPGPFVIEDLYPTNFGGDLDVTVTEADGRQQRFTVNFSAVPQALRPGANRFSATVGTLHDRRGDSDGLGFAEATYARGISNRFTALGGVQLGEAYQALLLGGAVNTRIGAFGADATHSRARLPNGQQPAGNSLRLNYQRYAAATGTHIGLAALRYSTRGYLTMGDFASARGDDWGLGQRARQRLQMNVSQRIGARSTVSLSGGHVRYWDAAPQQTDFQLSLQSRIGRATWSLSALRYRLREGRQDTRYSANLSVPLGSAPQAPRLSTLASQSTGGAQAQLALSGSLGDDRTVSYSLSSSAASRGAGSTSAYATWQAGHGTLAAGYSRTGTYHAFNASAAGSVVLHAGGITTGAPVGDGFALVQAEGAQGARVGYGSGARIGRNGYALLPHVSPYRWNKIELDPTGLPLEVELLQSSQRVAPTAGSIVRVAFNATREQTLFIEATDALGQPLPFAAHIEDDSGRSAGAVGQGGVIQLRGAAAHGALIVDPRGERRCRLQYQLPNAPDAYGLSWTQAVCAPLPPPTPTQEAARDAADGAPL